MSKCESRTQWQAVHKVLLRDDAQYRERHTSFLIALGCLSAPLLAVYGFYFGLGVLSFDASLLIIICAATGIIYVAWRQRHFMNQRIQRHLQSSPVQ